jgi:AraC-like DNA-binding protein
MQTLTLPELDHAGRYRASEPRCAWHAHRGFELLLVESGRCRVEIEGCPDAEAGPGSLFLVPPRRAHVHHNRGPVATAYAVFRLPPRLLPERLRQVRLAAGDPLPGRLGQVIDLHRGLERPDPRETGGLLLAILARLDHLDPPARPAQRPRALVLAERHLLASLAGPVAMAELAEVAGVSTGHLRALFRGHHGCPPARWHRQRRIELAQRLLRDSRLSAAEVAVACGWTDANLFGRIFRSACGMAPGRWRDQAASAISTISR